MYAASFGISALTVIVFALPSVLYNFVLCNFRMAVSVYSKRVAVQSMLFNSCLIAKDLPRQQK